jgi:hypothetical protein
MLNETNAKSTGDTIIEKGKPQPTDLSEQNEAMKDAEAENEEERDEKPARDVERPDLPPGALDEDGSNQNDDVTAA